MSTSKARRELGWRPQHDALQTLRETIAATRMDPDPLRRGGPARHRLGSAWRRAGDTEGGRSVAVVTDSTPYLPRR